ncbi:hypothetical protein HDU83_004253 [Entophlyctis luteolus]|nr:hypothetical protein HDU83_004253 [Entophlyctis luteolus]
MPAAILRAPRLAGERSVRTMHTLPGSQPRPQPRSLNEQPVGCAWTEYPHVSETTRAAVAALGPTFARMTLVQDAVMAALFGLPPPAKDDAAAPAPLMASASLPLTLGIPDETGRGSVEVTTVEAHAAALALKSQPPSPDSPQAAGPDLLVKSKTGTGKTLAFVAAAIESVLKSPEGFSKTNTVGIMIISPTRELAYQIYDQSSHLLKAHGLRTIKLVGGEDRAKQIKKLVYDPTQVIIGTPGRILDIILNEPKMKKRLRGLKVLVYDEADVLLDQNFASTMWEIQQNLPPQSTRQTFMFSATLSTNVKNLAAKVLRPSNIVSIDMAPAKTQVQTHLTTSQTYVKAPFSLQPQVLYRIIRDHQQKTEFAKIMVFFQTTHATQYLAEVWNMIPDLEVMELHSQMESRERTKVSDRFRACRRGILFTSDVSARGVDYPDVTLVLQVGAPRTLEQYVHRVGRTGRAGKTGESILLMSAYDEPFLKNELLKTGTIPIKRNVKHEPLIIARDDNALAIIKEAYKHGNAATGSAAYAAFFGFYRSMSAENRFDALTMAKAAEEFALGLCGMPETPKLTSGLLTRLGIRRTDGVKVLTPAEEAREKAMTPKAKLGHKPSRLNIRVTAKSDDVPSWKQKLTKKQARWMGRGKLPKRSKH